MRLLFIFLFSYTTVFSQTAENFIDSENKTQQNKIIVFFVMDTVNNANHSDYDIGVDHDYRKMNNFFEVLAKKLNMIYIKYPYLNLTINPPSTILDKFKNIDSSSDDILVFCNASHGSFSGNDDFPKLNWGSQEVSLRDIINIFRKKHNKKIFIINSSCNSTGLSKEEKPNTNILSLHEFKYKNGYPISESFIENIKTTDGVICFSAAKAGQFGWANSDFGNYFFNFFIDAACDNTIKFDNWEELSCEITKIYKNNTVKCDVVYNKYQSGFKGENVLRELIRYENNNNGFSDKFLYKSIDGKYYTYIGSFSPKSNTYSFVRQGGQPSFSWELGPLLMAEFKEGNKKNELIGQSWGSYSDGKGGTYYVPISIELSDPNGLGVEFNKLNISFHFKTGIKKYTLTRINDKNDCE